MNFISRHATWFWAIGGLIVLVIVVRLLTGKSVAVGGNGPTAADIANQGTVTPGTTIYAPSAIGAGVPSGNEAGSEDIATAVYGMPQLGMTDALYAQLMGNLGKAAPIMTAANGAATGYTAALGANTKAVAAAIDQSGTLYDHAAPAGEISEADKKLNGVT